MGAGALSLLIGIAGVAVIVVAVLRGRRWGGRRTVGVAGAGMLALGLSLSGLVDVFARALAILTFNPLRWVGLVVAGLGLVMLSSAGMLPGRRRGAREVAREKDPARREVTGSGGTPARAAGDDDMAEIEEILRRRGIS